MQQADEAPSTAEAAAKPRKLRRDTPSWHTVTFEIVDPVRALDDVQTHNEYLEALLQAVSDGLGDIFEAAGEWRSPTTCDYVKRKSDMLLTLVSLAKSELKAEIAAIDPVHAAIHSARWGA